MYVLYQHIIDSPVFIIAVSEEVCELKSRAIIWRATLDRYNEGVLTNHWSEGEWEGNKFYINGDYVITQTPEI